jgi:hypothetical protein
MHQMEVVPTPTSSHPPTIVPSTNNDQVDEDTNILEDLEYRKGGFRCSNYIKHCKEEALIVHAISSQ